MKPWHNSYIGFVLDMQRNRGGGDFCVALTRGGGYVCMCVCNVCMYVCMHVCMHGESMHACFRA